jgi:hypothetical protein
MKRKDFLRKMRNRRRGAAPIEERRPERRRATDWRTLRFELPQPDDAARSETTPVGGIELVHEGARLTATSSCWVRGYRRWRTDEGETRAEFQYRPASDEEAPPAGSTALAVGERWEPEG